MGEWQISVMRTKILPFMSYIKKNREYGRNTLGNQFFFTKHEWDLFCARRFFRSSLMWSIVSRGAMDVKVYA